MPSPGVDRIGIRYSLRSVLAQCPLSARYVNLEMVSMPARGSSEDRSLLRQTPGVLGAQQRIQANLQWLAVHMGPVKGELSPPRLQTLEYQENPQFITRPSLVVDIGQRAKAKHGVFDRKSQSPVPAQRNDFILDSLRQTQEYIL